MCSSFTFMTIRTATCCSTNKSDTERDGREKSYFCTHELLTVDESEGGGSNYVRLLHTRNHKNDGLIFFLDRTHEGFIIKLFVQQLSSRCWACSGQHGPTHVHSASTAATFQTQQKRAKDSCSTNFHALLVQETTVVSLSLL